jgi:hypothetical protein
VLDTITKNRFETALASGKLRELAEEMTAEGLSQVAICHLFQSFLQFLGEAHREADEDTLRDCLDCIVGFISRQSWWFDHYLTNEEIDEYRKTIA